MAGGFLDDRTAGGANLRVGAGRRIAGGVAGGLNGFQLGRPAAGAGILGHALADAGGFGNGLALAVLVAHSGGVVGHKGAAAALAAVDGLAAGFAGGGNGLGFVAVRQSGGDLGNVSISADTALFHRIAGIHAGRGHRVGSIFMLALAGDADLCLTAALADVQGLAVRLAGGLADDNALPRMAEGIGIIPLFDLAAAHAQIAVIAQCQAGGLHAVQLGKAVICAVTGLAGIAAVTVRVAAPAGAGVLALIVEPDIGNAVFRHALAVIGVGDLIVDGVLALLGVAVILSI